MTQKKRQLIWGVLIGLNLALIWGNSLLPGKQSGDLSGGIVGYLCKMIPFLEGKEWAHLLIRKLAHFSEFGLLGLLSGGFAVSEWQKIPFSICGAGLFAACVDETIQLLVPGRGPSLVDVWIDTSGYVTGLLVLALGYHLIKNKQVWRKS